MDAKLDDRVAEVFPLIDIAKAHEAIEGGGNNGTVLVSV